jgi:hypothetical protein
MKFASFSITLPYNNKGNTLPTHTKYNKPVNENVYIPLLKA